MVPLKFVVKRVITYVITIFIAVTLTFILLRIPGFVSGQSPLQSYFQKLEMTGQVSGEAIDKLVKAYTQEFGLDRPVQAQYVSWLARLMQGDMGLSLIWFPTPVSTLIANSLPWTIGLLIMVILIS